MLFEGKKAQQKTTFYKFTYFKNISHLEETILIWRKKQKTAEIKLINYSARKLEYLFLLFF